MAQIALVEGLQKVGVNFFAAQANWYILLGAGTLPAAGDTLATITEVTGVGGRQAAATASISNTTDGDYQKFTLPKVTFTGEAGGASAVATWAALCSVASGTSGVLIAAVDLEEAQQKQLAQDDIMEVTFALEFGPD